MVGRKSRKGPWDGTYVVMEGDRRRKRFLGSLTCPEHPNDPHTIRFPDRESALLYAFAFNHAISIFDPKRARYRHFVPMPSDSRVTPEQMEDFERRRREGYTPAKVSPQDTVERGIA